MAKAKTDKAFLERLAREAPSVLDAEVNFDATVERVLRAPPGKPKKRKRKERR